MEPLAPPTTRFAEPLPSPHPPTEHVVADDRPCLKCGYSLRGLTSTGVCPECGTDVARSLQGNLLRYSDRVYLVTLHRGAIVAEVALGTMILLTVAEVTGMAAGAFAPRMLGLFQVASAAVSIASLAGWWVVTASDPAFLGRDTGASSRKVLRVTLAISAGFLMVRQAMFALALWTPASGAMGIMGVLALASGVAWIVSYFATMLYIRWLGRRVPDEKLRGRAKLMMWLGPILVIGVVATALTAAFVGPLALLPLAALGIGALVWALLYVGLIDRLRVTLGSVRAVAEVIEAGKGSGRDNLPSG